MPSYMLSTSDNPYNPFKDWDLWFAFDTQNGYNSCSYLARMCDAYADASPEDEEKSEDEDKPEEKESKDKKAKD